MADLEDGKSVEVQGSGSNRYTLKNVGGVYSCSCPAWRNQGTPIERRTCKHLRAYRGDDAEATRCAPKEGDEAAPSRPSGERAAGARAPAVKKEGAPALLLAHSWENDVDLSGWWMSEKLDGVRAYWDGKTFWSRLGNELLAPDWFVKGLPETPLDGELFGGRKKFQRTVGIVKRQDRSEHWKELAYHVFDAPAHAAPFEERLSFVRATLETGALAYAKPHPHERCRDVAHLKEELARVEALGGEGLMLRKPGSRYETGRSSTLLKVKSFKDAEAIVRDHVAGAGRHKGRLGALLVELPDGTRFKVGTGFSDAERKTPPPVGSVVCFRYQELSDGGVPRFPSYVGLRIDKAWPPAPEDEPASPGGARAPGVAATSAGTHDRADAPAAHAEGESSGDESADKAVAGSAAPASSAPPTPAPGAPAAPAPAVPGRRRHFELREGGSGKFWEIEVTGTTQRVRFGKIGANGQTKIKTFPDTASAARESEALVVEKTKKGYRET